MSDEQQWDEAQAVTRTILEMQAAHKAAMAAAMSRIVSVELMAERALSKGYDLDPAEVLDAVSEVQR